MRLQTHPQRQSDQAEGVPISQAARLSQGEIENLAEEVRKRSAFSEKASILDLVRRLDGRVEFVSRLEDGRIEVNGPRDFTIYVTKFNTPSMNRFAIAHELAHYILHAFMGEKKLVEYRIPHSTDRVEVEANLFALALLMPEKAFSSAYNRSADPESLAARFRVTPSVVDARKKSLGLPTDRDLH